MNLEDEEKNQIHKANIIWKQSDLNTWANSHYE